MQAEATRLTRQDRFVNFQLVAADDELEVRQRARCRQRADIAHQLRFGAILLLVSHPSWFSDRDGSFQHQRTVLQVASDVVQVQKVVLHALDGSTVIKVVVPGAVVHLRANLKLHHLRHHQTVLQQANGRIHAENEFDELRREVQRFHARAYFKITE